MNLPNSESPFGVRGWGATVRLWGGGTYVALTINPTPNINHKSFRPSCSLRLCGEIPFLQKLRNELVFVEVLEIGQFFARADEAGRNSKFVLNGNNDAPFA